MNKFNPHNYALENFFESIIDTIDREALAELVNLDSADSVLRTFLSIDEMREFGSFFTGQELSTCAVAAFNAPISLDSVVLDPTCGTGNLLIEFSRRLEVKEYLSETLRQWGKVLAGFDIHESFIRATKLRLVLEALNRGVIKDCTIDEAQSLLSKIIVKDAMSVTAQDLCNTTHLLMNPPFSSWDSPRENYWRIGKVNAAGVVFDHYLRRVPPNCAVSAILPDVLRSGSRYQNWRDFVEANIDGHAEIAGRFNEKTDIDVFLIHGFATPPQNQTIIWFPEQCKSSTISEHYDVCIGPLVAYRDPLEGPSSPYAHSKNTPLWSSITNLSETRNFKGRLIEPPFVVIRRTSSPSDKFRASAAIINESFPVAVENHLIVVKPRSNSLEDCHRLVEVLKSKRTNDFINNRIRCRHLTVGVVKDIPLW
ncbi:N-6 DNA methylase [Pseudomonas soli]|uniref:N-6 DNA methylase n=1 Tax=Pseudomonas soli TaxID=1306993 RepID=UPI0038268E31